MTAAAMSPPTASTSYRHPTGSTALQGGAIASSVTAATAAAKRAEQKRIYESALNKHATGHAYQHIQRSQRADLAVRLVCKYCPGKQPYIIEEFKSGDLVCGHCGTVFPDRIIDTRSEWRTFASDEGGDDPSRVGGAADRSPDGALETNIADGRAGLGGSRGLQVTHAKTAGRAARAERDVLDTERKLRAMSEKLGVPGKVVTTGCSLLRTIAEHMPLKHKDTFAAVALLLGARRHGFNFALQECADLAGVEKTAFGKTVNLVKKTTGMNINKESTADIGARAADALDLPTYAGAMLTSVIAKAADYPEIAGRTPQTLLGAALWMVSHLIGKPLEQGVIAKHVGVTFGTIRQCYAVMFRERDQFVSESMRQYDVAAIPQA